MLYYRQVGVRICVGHVSLLAAVWRHNHIIHSFKHLSGVFWVGKIPWRRERLPTPVFCPGEFHGHGVAKSPKRLSDFHFTDLPGVI